MERGQLRDGPRDQVELHVYRIMEEAVGNALKHAAAHAIKLYGQLTPGQIDLAAEDDGVGFAVGDKIDLARLLADKHFGLAGMYERAALLNAELRIDSAPGRGTRVRLEWRASASGGGRGEL